MKGYPLFSISTIFILVLLMSGSSVLADVAPNNAKEIRVQTEQDYPDFDFYYGSIPPERVTKASYGTENYYNNLELTPITVSPNYPFDVPNQDWGASAYFWAVKKSLGLKNDSELKNKAISVLKKEKIDGIYFFYLSNRVTDFKDEGKSVVYTITAINEAGITTNHQYDYINYSVSGKSKSVFLIIGLALTAVFIALGIIFIKRLRKS